MYVLCLHNKKKEYKVSSTSAVKASIKNKSLSMLLFQDGHEILSEIPPVQGALKGRICMNDMVVREMVNVACKHLIFHFI